MAGTFDPNIFQAALIQVAEATQAAAAAAQAVSSSTAYSSSATGGTGGNVKPAVDWSKLIARPSNFDNWTFARSGIGIGRCVTWWPLTKAINRRSAS